ncbi:GntR family transcriptional regulator [Luteococcus sp. OSA5]|uniref:GntR family transcriptional regulator n=1 Tax=Luteococcus sp. OSA5 TaxID=3401630 RepID=UPI003B435CF4
MSLAALNRSTLREQLLDRLREGILDGTFPPGSRMAEVELSSQFGVSRGTVREALRILQNSGLLEGKERNSLYVRKLSKRDIEELFQVRDALEGRAVTLFLKRPDAQEIVSQMATQLPESGEGMSYAQRFEIDLDFHQILVASAGNTMLLNMWCGIKDLMRIAALAWVDEGAASLMTSAHHQPIIDALRTGDPDRVRPVLSEHMEAAAELLGTKAEA